MNDLRTGNISTDLNEVLKMVLLCFYFVILFCLVL